jgi:HPt (histidine-containing phosphotransfer) domain-containing protein
MDNLLRDLDDWGCDIDGAMERFLGETDLYENCLETVAEDNAFIALGEALKDGNATEAFEQAHTLKGVLANLGLTPMYDIVVQLVEPLRVGYVENLSGIYEELLSANENLKELLAR